MVGAHLLYELTSSGQNVKALRRAQSNTNWVKKIFSYYTTEAEKLFTQIEWVEGDILDFLSLEEALKGISCIYHCAAIVSFHGDDHDIMLTLSDGEKRNIASMDPEAHKFLIYDEGRMSEEMARKFMAGRSWARS